MDKVGLKLFNYIKKTMYGKWVQEDKEGSMKVIDVVKIEGSTCIVANSTKKYSIDEIKLNWKRPNIVDPYSINKDGSPINLRQYADPDLIKEAEEAPINIQSDSVEVNRKLELDNKINNVDKSEEEKLVETLINLGSEESKIQINIDLELPINLDIVLAIINNGNLDKTKFMEVLVNKSSSRISESIVKALTDYIG